MCLVVVSSQSWECLSDCYTIWSHASTQLAKNLGIRACSFQMSCMCFKQRKGAVSQSSGSLNLNLKPDICKQQCRCRLYVPIRLFNGIPLSFLVPPQFIDTFTYLINLLALPQNSSSRAESYGHTSCLYTQVITVEPFRCHVFWFVCFISMSHTLRSYSLFS